MKTYTTEDKSTWGPGPWQEEPDKMSWTDEATGLPCLIVRNSAGALCGYVGVAAGHPWHGIGYSGCVTGTHDEYYCDCTPGAALQVHGGITYADACQVGAAEAEGICHIPEPGASDDVWWFGFDTNHGGDFAPKSAARMNIARIFLDDVGGRDATYRDVAYVQAEIASLAAQLVEVTA